MCLALCDVEDCDIAGRHAHDGVTYCGSCHEDGFCNGQCLTLCPVEGCTTAGRHSHSGVTYCGTRAGTIRASAAAQARTRARTLF